MASQITLVPKDEALAALDISTGTGVGIWLDQGQEALFPVPALAEAWSQGESGEGSKRISFRPENSQATGTVYIAGEDDEEFRHHAELWQIYVHSINAFGGTVEYAPQGGETITYEIRSMQITSMPQDGNWIKAHLGVSEFAITFAPYGDLDDIEVFSGITSTLPITGFEVGERAYEAVIKSDSPSLYWRLGTEGAKDSSGNGRVGTGVGGVVAGSATGALANDADKATTFDGTNDLITSGYAVYAAASVRTFEGWGYRANSSANHTLIGGSGVSNPVYLRCDNATQNVTFTPNNGSINTWTGAWPGNTQWVHWALTFDDPNNRVELFINGVSKGSQPLTATYSSPGNFQIGMTGATGAPWNGRLDEVATYTTALNPERIFSHYLAGKYRQEIPGSAPAKVKLTIAETQGTTRDHFEYGLDNTFDPFEPTTLLIDSPTEVVTSEFAGASASRTGAYSVTGSETNIVRATLYTTPVALCSFTTAAIGKSRIKARIYGGGTASTYVRLAWRIGEGEFTRNEWIKLSSTEAFWEIDLGVMNAPKAEVGTQSIEGRIEAYANESGETIDLDVLYVIPLAAYGKASVEASTEQSTAPVMYDDGLSHSAGALNGTAAPIGGTWTTVKGSTGEANIQVNEAKEFTYSTTNGDGGGKRAYAVTATPSAQSALVLRWDAKYETTAPGFYQINVGGIARYVDQWNWVAILLNRTSNTEQPYLSAIKSKSASTTYLSYTAQSSGFAQPGAWWSYVFAVDAAGVWSLAAGPRGASAVTYLTGQDADLATGGKLASGKVGLYGNPYVTSSGTTTVYWDNIAAFGLAPSKHLVNASRKLELTSNALRKEPVTGSVWTPQTLDGGYPKLEPNRVSRLVVKTRATNVDTNQDAPTSNGAVAPKTSKTASATGTTTAETTVARPTGTMAGSLLLGSLSYGSSGTPHGISLMAFTAEALWSRIKTDYGLNTFYWTATESDPTIVAVATGTTNTVLSAGLVNYFGVDIASPVNVSATASGTGTAVTAPSVTTTVPNTLIVVAIGAVSTGGTTPSVSVAPTLMSQAVQLGAAGTGIRAYQAQYTDPIPQGTPGASGTRAFTLNTSSEWVAHTIALAPAKTLDGFSASLTITPRVQLVSN